jgi:hypothetical protein
MKKYLIIITLALFCKTGSAQSREAQQLLLNWEKLTQLKKILQNMYDGYRILDKGYSTIKDLSQGNFSLHKTFLDGLIEVSPVVRKYKRIADIINIQLRIVKEYKTALKEFKENGQFTADEMDYLEKVYVGLFHRSVQNLDELTMVITAGRLRMSDDERLQAIDRIYHSIIDQYGFLQDFTNSAIVLSLQRQNEQMDIDIMQKVHGVK